MNEFNNNLNTPDGREWLAMRFVLGDLSEEESAAFDVALTDNSELCELVAQAAQLIAGIATLRVEKSRIVDVGQVSTAVSQFESQRFVRGANNDYGARRMWSVKAALLTVIMLGMFICISPNSPESTGGQVLVDLESYGHDEMSQLQLELDAVEAEKEDSSVPLSEDHAISTLEAPEWLMSAVELEQESGDSRSSPDNAGVL